MESQLLSEERQTGSVWSSESGAAAWQSASLPPRSFATGELQNECKAWQRIWPMSCYCVLRTFCDRSQPWNPPILYSRRLCLFLVGTKDPSAMNGSVSACQGEERESISACLLTTINTGCLDDLKGLNRRGLASSVPQSTSVSQSVSVLSTVVGGAQIGTHCFLQGLQDELLAESYLRRTTVGASAKPQTELPPTPLSQR